VANYWEQVIIMNDHQKRRFSVILCKHYIIRFQVKNYLSRLGFLKDTNDTRESAAIYVADDLINENAIAVYDP
jgi:UDPglucose 6-dehydrogenase